MILSNYGITMLLGQRKDYMFHYSWINSSTCELKKRAEAWGFYTTSIFHDRIWIYVSNVKSNENRLSTNTVRAHTQSRRRAAQRLSAWRGTKTRADYRVTIHRCNNISLPDLPLSLPRRRGRGVTQRSAGSLAELPRKRRNTDKTTETFQSASLKSKCTRRVKWLVEARAGRGHLPNRFVSGQHFGARGK